MSRADPAELYDRDFYAWTQEQSERLRRLAPADDRLDVANVAAEIADLGQENRRALENHLILAVQHVCQAAALPQGQTTAQWLDEAEERAFQARQRLEDSPSLRQYIDVERVWRKALTKANRKLELYADPTLPADLPGPFRAGELVDETFKASDGAARVAAAGGRDL
jgi:hypothetical protein